MPSVVRPRGGFVVVLAALLMLGALGVQRSSAAASTISGASQAVCSPAPCAASKRIPSYTLANVSNDNGTTSTRAYGIYRPANLTSSPGNLAPAVLVFYGSGNCGLVPSSEFASMAPANRFVVVYMESPCGRDNNWDKRNVDTPTTASPNDEPYVSAVVDDITRCPTSGAGPNQCVDLQRIYAAGTSSGGNMVADVMCDAQNSTLFRGYLIDSSSLEQFNGAPDCPSTNRSFFVMMALSNYGIDGGLYYGTSSNPHLDVPAFADWAATRLSCGGPRIADGIGSPVASTLRYTYSSGCAYAVPGSAAIETLGVQNGGHTWACQDSDPAAAPNECPAMPNPPGLGPGGLPETNGLSIEGQFWSFVAQGVSSAAPAPPLDTSPPATVSIIAPTTGSRVSGNFVRLSAAASDNVGVAGVQFELDGAKLGPKLTSASGGSYSITWDTTTASDGAHTLQAVADDAAGNTSTSPIVLLSVDNDARRNPLASPSYVALGDGYSSGDGDPPYLVGTDTPRDRCHRSLLSYPVLASLLLGRDLSSVGLHGCSGARLADFYRPAPGRPEPRQLQWVDRSTRVVSVSAGWADASLPAVMQSCVLEASRCEAAWHRRVDADIRAMRARSRRSRESLYALYRQIRSAAPKAKVIVFGYPRLFSAPSPARCRTGVGSLNFTLGAMKWIDSEIQQLDDAIQTAAVGAHVTYVAGSYRSFAGHERCTREPDVHWAISNVGAGGGPAGGILEESFTPNQLGQLAIAQLLRRLF
jgi:poly(3-hydroxybutyrate) depolymerase